MIPSNIGQKVEYNYDNKYFAQSSRNGKLLQPL